MSFKLHFHCGDWVRRPPDPTCILMGQLTATQADMSQYGYGLSEIFQDTHVFSNDSNVFNGLRHAVIDGKIDPENITIYYYRGDEIYYPKISRTAEVDHWPPGFHDQSRIDLADIMKKRRDLNVAAQESQNN